MGITAGIPENAVSMSWEVAEELAVDLSNEVDLVHQLEPYDFMLVFPRGGWFPALILSQRLRDLRGSRILSASMSSYKPGSTDREEDFTLGQLPTEEHVKGKRGIMVDEVCHTGDTLALGHEMLMGLGAVAVDAAVLTYKPQQSKSGYVPRFYASIDERWIDYPWERHDWTRLGAVPAQAAPCVSS
jgi:hypoxanthine phosphoribosyltransferase